MEMSADQIQWFYLLEAELEDAVYVLQIRR
jgi:hypothetical protein